MGRWEQLSERADKCHLWVTVCTRPSAPCTVGAALGQRLYDSYGKHVPPHVLSAQVRVAGESPGT